MVIRMKKPEAVRALSIRPDLMERYEARLVANRQKEVQIMKMNNENECSRCGAVYNVHVNKGKVCAGQPHLPAFQ